jgi:hypothetical protein
MVPNIIWRPLFAYFISRIEFLINQLVPKDLPYNRFSDVMIGCCSMSMMNEKSDSSSQPLGSPLFVFQSTVVSLCRYEFSVIE